MKTSTKKNGESRLLIAIALACEAKPLLAAMGFEHQQSAMGFRLYHSKNQALALVITGTGRVAMAAGVTWASQRSESNGESLGACLNIGSAGHGDLPLGRCVRVHKITEEATGKVLYPAMITKWRHDSVELKTLDVPSNSYEAGVAYDMEAAAFVATARRFVSAEFAQVLKVVSDNPQADFYQLNAARLTELIQNNIALISEFVSQQLTLMQECGIEARLPMHDIELMIENIQQRWHLTVSRKHQLRALLSTQVALQLHADETPPHWNDSDSIKVYIAELQRWNMAVAPRLVHG